MDLIKFTKQLSKLAEELSNSHPEEDYNNLEKINKLLHYNNKEFSKLVQEYFFEEIENFHISSFKYFELIANICLKNNLHYLARELLNYLIIHNVFEEKYSYNILYFSIQIIIEFSLHDYVDIDSDAERIRIYYKNESFPINMKQIEVDTRFSILKILHETYTFKLKDDKNAEKQKIIRKYNQIISQIRAEDKNYIKKYRWCRLYALQSLEYRQEIEYLFKNKPGNAEEFEEVLCEYYNILLCPTFGRISFNEQKITFINEGNGCIEKPVLGIWQDSKFITEIKVNSTCLAGDNCTFYLDKEKQSNILKKINRNGNKVELHLNFNKFDSSPFKLICYEDISDFLKVLQVSNLSDDSNQLLKDIIDKLIRMMERKNTKKIEDLHNDELTHWLRDKGYIASDQTRTGLSNSNAGNAGEVDIMIRTEKNGTPVSIIEAFRLLKFDTNNIVSHISKLLHKYDTAGHEKNYIIVYAEHENFSELWEKYFNYVKDKLNEHNKFEGRYLLEDFEDTGKVFSEKTDIKVGLAKHKREGNIVEVYHIFVNMYIF